jgi:excisionase family DNA binding protein
MPSLQTGQTARRALTVREFRDAYRVSHSTVYAWIRNGTLPDVRIGGKRLIPIDAAERLLRPGEVR